MENDATKPMIPSTAAAARFGVTNDYVALLCRKKKVEGALMGRVWYVEPTSLSAFLEQSERERAARNAELKEKLKKEYHQKNISEAVLPKPTSAHAVKPVYTKTGKQDIGTSLKSPISLDLLAPAAFAFFLISGVMLQTYAGGGAVFAHREPIQLSWQPLERPLVVLPTRLAQETIGNGLQDFVDVFVHGLETAPQGPVLPQELWFVRVPTLSDFVARELAAGGEALARVLTATERSMQSASVAGTVGSGWCSLLKLFNKQACADTATSTDSFVYVVTPAKVAVEAAAPNVHTNSAPATPAKTSAPTNVSVVAVAPAAQTTAAKYVTQDLLTQKLDELSNSLKSLVYAQLSVPGSLPATGGIHNIISLSQKIDRLDSVTITNATVSSGSISASSIPPLSDLSGILAITKGGTGTSSAPTYGKVLLGNASGGYDLVATSSLGISGSGSSQWTTSGSDIYYTTGSVGIGTTSPWAQLSINPNGITGPAFAIGSSTQTLFRVDVTGNVSISGALTVASCTGCGGGAYPFDLAGNATSTLTQFNGGLTAYASSTIGSGAQGGGLTVLGGATTTGNMLVRGNLGLGTSVTTPGSALQFSNLTDSIRFGTSGYSFITGGSGTLALGVQGSSESIRAGTSGVVAGVTPTTHSTPTYAFAAVRRSGTSGSTITPVATFLNTLSSGNPSNGYGTSVLLQARLGSSDSTLVAHEAYWADINSSGTSNYDIRLLRAGATTTVMSLLGASGNIGIGTTSPWAQLSVNPDGISGPAFAIGSSTATNFVVTTAGNVGVGTTSPWRVLSVEVADANGIFSGTGATPLVLERRTVNSNVSLEFRNTTASWFAGQGSGGDFNLDTDNNLGGAPKLALTTGGALTVASCTGCSSDQRLKTNVTTLASSTALEHLQQLRPVTFTWAGPVFGVEMSTTTMQYGFIAQEALEAFPDLVYRDRETELTPGGTYLFNYQGLISPIVAAIQEIAAIGGAFKDALVAWLGDATNGITKLFAKEVHTDKLCVGNTCVTEEEFLALVAGAGISSSPTPAPAPVPELEPTPAATSTPSAPEAPAKESVAESEPEPTPEETAPEPPPAEPVASEPAPEAPAPAGEPTAVAN